MVRQASTSTLYRDRKILLSEALDRVSRDQADVEMLYKHLRFAGVMIVTLHGQHTHSFHHVRELAVQVAPATAGCKHSAKP